jgi:poly(3-hydroxybutyrate) depolymerase
MPSGSRLPRPGLLVAVAILLYACASDDGEHSGSPGVSGGATNVGGTNGGATRATGGTWTGTGSAGGGTGGASDGSGGVSTGGSGVGGLLGSGGMSTGGGGAGGLVGSGGMSTGGSGVGGLLGSGGVSAGGSGVGGLVGSGGVSTGGGGAGGLVGSGGVSTGGSGVGGFATGGQSAAGGDGGGGSDSGGAAGAGAVIPSAGCGKDPSLTSGQHSIQSNGQNRSFILRIPDTYDNNHPHRLVFAFHWNGGSAEDVDGGGTSGYTWSYYGLRERADNSTIFVAPQGNNAGWANPGGEDLAFVDDMINLIEDDLCVDRTQLFAMGFSYGGGMSYAIACARATVFRAVAVYSGAQLSGCDGGTEPIAYMGIHGIRDPICSIAGGRALRDTFVRNNGCTDQNPPEPAEGSLTHTVTAYSGCRPGYPVVWAAFDGAGHSPAPVDGSTSDSGGGDRTWTKEEVWNFFTQFETTTP